MPEERPYVERPAARPSSPTGLESDPSSSTGPMLRPAESQPKRLGALGWTLSILAGLAVVGTVIGVSIASANGGSSGTNGRGGGADQGLAIVACQNVVKQNLKSPSTASFPSVPTISGNTIAGQVDSENGFGAMLRTNFQCTIVGDSVRLDSLGSLNLQPSEETPVPTATSAQQSSTAAPVILQAQADVTAYVESRGELPTDGYPQVEASDWPKNAGSLSVQSNDQQGVYYATLDDGGYCLAVVQWGAPTIDIGLTYGDGRQVYGTFAIKPIKNFVASGQSPWVLQGEPRGFPVDCILDFQPAP